MPDADKSSLGQKSGFGHHMLEAQRVIELKTAFEDKLLTGDFEDSRLRDEMYILAGVMASEIKSLASMEEKMLFAEKRQKITDRNRNITGLHSALRIDSSLLGGDAALDSAIKSFVDACHEFNDFFIQVQDRANLQYMHSKDQGEMARYLSFNEVDYRFYNDFGILISPQMEFFCRGLYTRARRNQHNVIIIGAKMGKGKSSFALAGATTLSTMLNIPFDVNTNVILSESREYCERLMSNPNLPHGSSIIFDQAGNQMSAASRWEDDQVNLLNKVDLNRFHNLTLWINWHAAKALDKDIRERVSTHEVAIDKVGGPAIVKGFNLNPHSTGPVVNTKTRNRIAITPDQAHEITEADMLKLLEVPFYALDKNSSKESQAFWEAYSVRKERSSQYARKIVGKIGGVDLFYDDFLASLPEGVIRVDNQALENYGQSKATYLSMRELAKRIARATYGKADKIFKNTNLLNLNEGYIDIDGVVASYVKRLRAQKEGALQAAREQREAK